LINFVTWPGNTTGTEICKAAVNELIDSLTLQK
jgi:hypothetical protein